MNSILVLLLFSTSLCGYEELFQNTYDLEITRQELSDNALILHLTSHEFVDVAKARKLLLKCLAELEQKVEDIDLEIQFFGKDGAYPPPKCVSFVRSKRGKITYATMLVRGGLAIKRRESIEDAKTLADLTI